VLLTLQMPQLGKEMALGTIFRVLVAPGGSIERGSMLAEVRVDLSDIAEQNCAPISLFRIVAAESGWIRSFDAKPGDRIDVGGPLALASTERDEPVKGNQPARALRVSVGAVHYAA
jgi:pyruvate/2-oxoglutarate dehydrogenase complex dihydrolipoamide acyltransferase (E2) component